MFHSQSIPAFLETKHTISLSTDWIQHQDGNFSESVERLTSTMANGVSICLSVDFHGLVARVAYIGGDGLTCKLSLLSLPRCFLLQSRLEDCQYKYILRIRQSEPGSARTTSQQLKPRVLPS